MEVIKTPQWIQKLFPSIYWKIETQKKEIYLTFDDSPTPKFTRWILDILNHFEIKATFFCIGQNAKKHPEIISNIILEGHALGYHGYSHMNGFLSLRKSYLLDLEKCKTVLPESKLFRPPYGKIYPWQISLIKKKYKIIMWDILSYDFQPKITKEKLISNVLNNIENGSIIVFHDNQKSEKVLKQALPKILKNLQSQGFKFNLFS